MAATPRTWWGPLVGTVTISKPFQAQFSGQCSGCETQIDAGDEVLYVGGQLYLNHECTDDEPTPNSIEPSIEVMPRGKTSKDRCNRCFIVHASGQVECE